MVTEASGVSLVQRPGAGGYDRIDALGGADGRRLVDHAAGVVLEIGAGTRPRPSPGLHGQQGRGRGQARPELKTR